MKSTDWGGYAEVQSHANVHLRLDFVALMVMGIFMFSLPLGVLKLHVSTVYFIQANMT